MPTNGQLLRKSAKRFTDHVSKIERNCTNKEFAKSQIDRSTASFAPAALIQILVQALDSGMTSDVIFKDVREYTRDLALEKFRRLYSLKHALVSNRIQPSAIPQHFRNPDSDDFSTMRPDGVIRSITEDWCHLIPVTRVTDTFNHIYSRVSPSRCVREIEYWVIANRNEIARGIYDGALPAIMAYHQNPHDTINTAAVAKRVRACMDSSPLALVVMTPSSMHIPLSEAKKSVGEILRRRKVCRKEMWSKFFGQNV